MSRSRRMPVPRNHLRTSVDYAKAQAILDEVDGKSKAQPWYPIDCKHGYDCCPKCDGERRDQRTLKPVI